MFNRTNSIIKILLYFNNSINKTNPIIPNKIGTTNPSKKQWAPHPEASGM